MGSQLKVTLWTTDEAKAIAAADRVSREFDRLESLLSVWKDGSDVVRLNAAAGRAPVDGQSRDARSARRRAHGQRVDRGQVRHHLRRARGHLEIRSRSGQHRSRCGGDRRAIAARGLSGRAGRRREAARRSSPGPASACTSAASARAMRWISPSRCCNAKGFRDFLIQAGGDMYAAGTNNGTPWTLGIADPRGAHDAFAAVEVRDATFSTSGDYERFFMKDGVRYHHLIDPDRGEPARGCRSVTIVADRAVIADVLVDRRLHHGPGRRHGADRAPAQCRRGDRHRVERGADLEWPQRPGRIASAADRRAVASILPGCQSLSISFRRSRLPASSSSSGMDCDG